MQKTATDWAIETKQDALKTVAKTTPSYLRLYNETRPESASRLGDFWPGLDRLCRAFEHATGWPLKCLPDAEQPADAVLWSAPASHDQAEDEQMRVGVATAEGRAAAQPPVELNAAVELAAGIGHLLGDLARARHGLWKVEAELAAGVPLAPRSNEPHLAQRLQASLRAAAEAIHGQAAALYLVDETTTYLKLRSVWGLPQERLLLPPRELARAAADLEAMLGHAVVLEDTAAHTIFQPPENAAAAVCVPVASSTAPLGTLWVFSDRAGAFADHEVNMVEVVAGRIAAELEREMLVAAGAEAGQLKRQVSAAERWQEAQLPHVSPLGDLWQIAGWAQSAGELSGEFYDWFVRADESLAISLGACGRGSIASALSAAAVRASTRAHVQHADDPAVAVEWINQSLFRGSAGGQTASLALAFADAQAPLIRLALAGEAAAWKVTTAGATRLSLPAPTIGLDPETYYTRHEERFASGELLVLLSEGAVDTCRRAGQTGLDELTSLLAAHTDQSAVVLVELIHDQLTAFADEGPLSDCAALVLKCR
ncbi:MAG TPA: SpoIIE family protein phosphatase [Pirellulales bacterium]|nr:SpoIIE family protein phosphatase [Pirellulales bacterium]